MTESEVIEIMRQYYAGLFPKVCPRCRRRFETLREYVAVTTPTGRYVSYDVDVGNWTPDMGTIAFANCPCGDTLALGTDRLAHSVRATLLAWIKLEAERRSMQPSDLLDYLRAELRRRLLAEPA
jgi:hypothetical protein